MPEVDEAAKEVALTFFIDPGQRIYVRRINFKGNIETRDEVLRREMRQMEGAWMSTSAVARSKERLDRLGYFQEVRVETPPVPGASDQVDIEFEVEESGRRKPELRRRTVPGLRRDPLFRAESPEFSRIGQPALARVQQQQVTPQLFLQLVQPLLHRRRRQPRYRGSLPHNGCQPAESCRLQPRRLERRRSRSGFRSPSTTRSIFA